MRSRVLLTMIIVCALAVNPIAGQEQTDQALIYVLPGESLPKYVLVEQFFLFADAATAEDDVIKRHFYDQIGLEVGGAAEAAFKQAIEQSRALLFPHGIDSKTIVDSAAGKTDVFETSRASDEDPDLVAFDSAEHERQKVKGLAEIYGTLASALSAAGSSIAGVDAYISAEIAPSTSMASDEPLEGDATMLQLSALFEATARTQQ